VMYKCGSISLGKEKSVAVSIEVRMNCLFSLLYVNACRATKDAILYFRSCN